MLEFARHGRNSWLVEPNSVDALAEGMLRLLDDAELRRTISHGALATARSRRWDLVDDRLVEDYGRAIERHGAKRLALSA
jgi:glycosyltransferase involved in cell wall biosynthesis